MARRCSPCRCWSGAAGWRVRRGVSGDHPLEQSARNKTGSTREEKPKLNDVNKKSPCSPGKGKSYCRQPRAVGRCSHGLTGSMQPAPWVRRCPGSGSKHSAWRVILSTDIYCPYFPRHVGCIGRDLRLFGYYCTQVMAHVRTKHLFSERAFQKSETDQIIPRLRTFPTSHRFLGKSPNSLSRTRKMLLQCEHAHESPRGGGSTDSWAIPVTDSAGLGWTEKLVFSTL